MNKKYLNQMQKWGAVLRQYKYALLVIALGVILLLLPSAKTQRGAAQQQTQAQTEIFDLEAFESKLARILSQIEGVGKTQVILTLDRGSKQVLAQDQQRSGDGTYSAQTVTVGRGSGTQEVVALQEISPQFRGALVVCAGGHSAQVRLKLVEAVSAVTGLGADQISICQSNENP